MAYEDNTVDISVKQAQTQQLQSIAQAAEDARKKVKALSETLSDTFSLSDLSSYQKTMNRYGKNLASNILSLRMRLSALKTAFTDAAAPLAEAFLPAINQAVSGLRQFVQGVADVLDAIFGQEDTDDGLADSLESAVDAEKKLGSTAKSTAKAVKRSLMGFDQIERLDSTSGGSSGGSTNSSEKESSQKRKDTLSPQIQSIVDKIDSMLAPLREIDFSNSVKAFQNLKGAVSALGAGILSALEWVWFNILVPLADWTIEDAAPTAINLLTSALQLLSSILQPVWSGLKSIYTALSPVISFVADTALEVLQLFSGLFSALAQVFTEKGPEITGIFENIGTIFSTVWSVLQPVLEKMRSGFSTLFQNLSGIVATGLSGLIGLFNNLTGFLAGIFTGDFKGAFESLWGYLTGWVDTVKQLLPQKFQQAVNTVTTVLGTLGTKVSSVLNGAKSVIENALNSLLPGITTLLSKITTTFTTDLPTNVKAAFETLKNNTGTWVGGFGTVLKSAFSAAVSGASQTLGGVSTALNGVLNSAKTSVKNVANTIINFLNETMDGLEMAINNSISAINSVRFSIPNWVPVLGGKSFGLNISKVTLPDIPYLAQGAVLPANQPFLAMVGDQKHGTNVEAPLSVIQQAVAQVMTDMIPAVMAGFDAVLAEQRATRQAVCAIEVGDTVIGQAVSRYQQHLAVMNGG